MVEVLLQRGGQVVHTLSIGESPVYIGRAPGNDLVVSDPTVSGHHLVVWREPGALWIKDLGSTNGTFINERRITAPERVRDGDALRLGTTCSLRVRAAPDEVHQAVGRGLVLEDLRAGTRFPIPSDRFDIGSGPGAALRIPGPAVAATLIVHPDGEVRLGTDDEDRPLAIGAEFSVAGRAFRVIEVDPSRVVTVLPVADRYPYRLTVSLEGALGPEAVLEDLTTRASHRIDGGNRAVLLWVLGRRYREDRDKDIDPSVCGWCSDEEVMAAVWGRHGDENKLNVLVHRLRAELRTAGFDPWFIEKKQRYLRARLSEAEIR